MATKSKKVTAKELDEQIGFNKEIDANAIVAQMKKGMKKVRKEVSEATPAKKAVVATETSRKVLPPADKLAELAKKRAKKIKETLDKVAEVKELERKKTVIKVHLEPSKDGKSIDVWVCYKIEGYVRAVWKTYPTKSVSEAIGLAERYTSMILNETVVA